MLHGVNISTMKHVLCVNLVWISSALLVEGAIFLQVFDTLPQDREVNPGELISIPCRVRNRKGECAWLKDGVVVGKIPGKYTFDREPEDGDCGIVVTNTQLEEDDGLWQCQVTQASLQEGTLTSPEVKLTVREAPFPPLIEDGAIQIVRGDPFTSRAGEAKKLHCVARKGNPPAALKWFLDDEEITVNVNQTNVPDLQKRKTWQAVSALDVTFQKIDNHKTLKCIAVHDAYDTRSKEITVRLEILYPPEIRLEGRPKGEAIVEGMFLVLRCKADANPKANIIWRKSGHSGIYDIKDQIEFNQIRRTDSGVYSCSAKNDIGQSEEMETTVDVKYKPKINRVFPSPRTTVSLYHPTRLVCEAEGNPPPKYSWLQRIGGDPVMWQERASNATFYVHNVSYMFQGIYLCQASNVINGLLNTVKSEEIFLDVTGRPQIIFDSPIASPQHLVVDKDETAVIAVMFCADPRPKKTYWKWGLENTLEINDKTLKYTAESLQPVTMREDCYEARLVLTDAKSSDSMIYSFVVENDKGTEVVEVNLEVREPMALILIVGAAAVIVVLLLLFVSLIIYCAKREKCCFKRANGFKPASESIVENGCPSDSEKCSMTPKSERYAEDGCKNPTIATIGEDTYYPNGRKDDSNDNKELLIGSLDSRKSGGDIPKPPANCLVRIQPPNHSSGRQRVIKCFEGTVEQAYI